MLPIVHGAPAPFTSTHAPSEKEEIARAALRSLGGPLSSSPTVSHQLPPPSDEHFARSRHAPRPHSFAAFEPRQGPGPGPGPEPTHQAYGRVQHGFQPQPHAKNAYGYGSASMMELDDVSLSHSHSHSHPAFSPAAPAPPERTTSYFGSHCITESPTSSPRLEPMALAHTSLPSGAVSPPMHQPPSLSMSSSASTSVYEPLPSPDAQQASLRRVASSLKLDYDEVKHAVRLHFPQYLARSSLDTSNHSVSASYTKKPAVTRGLDEDTLRLVLDALKAEEERQAHLSDFRDAYITREREQGSHQIDFRPPPPPGQIWASDRPAWERSRHAKQSEPWAIRRPSNDALGRNPSAVPTPIPVDRHSGPVFSSSPQSAFMDGAMSTSPRSASPSPFAFDPLRRPSLPPVHNTRHGSGDSYRDSDAASSEVSDGFRHRWAGGISNEIEPSPPQFGRPAPFSDRKGRSIDDYLEQSNRHSQRYGRSRVLVPGFSEAEPSSSNHNRHSFQPYPQVSRGPTNGLPLTQSWSPGTSPSAVDSPKQSFAQLPRRSPLISSHPAATATATGAAPSPSPRLGAGGWGSPSVASEASDYMRVHDSVEPPSTQRGWSEDTAAEATRAKVEDMQLSDSITPAAGRSKLSPPAPHTQPKPHQQLRKSASVSASVSATRASRSASLRSVDSTASAGTGTGTEQLTRSEIMQRLQDKVKSRIAAKERGELLDADERPSRGRGRGSSSRSSSTTRRGQAKVTLKAANKAAMRAAAAAAASSSPKSNGSHLPQAAAAATASPVLGLEPIATSVVQTASAVATATATGQPSAAAGFDSLLCAAAVAEQARTA